MNNDQRIHLDCTERNLSLNKGGDFDYTPLPNGKWNKLFINAVGEETEVVDTLPLGLFEVMSAEGECLGTLARLVNA